MLARAVAASRAGRLRVYKEATLPAGSRLSLRATLGGYQAGMTQTQMATREGRLGGVALRDCGANAEPSCAGFVRSATSLMSSHLPHRLRRRGPERTGASGARLPPRPSGGKGGACYAAIRRLPSSRTGGLAHVREAPRSGT